MSVRIISRSPARRRGCAVTIGNFDGVHRGHQAVLGRLRERAAALGVEPLALTFEPLPHEFFLGGRAPPRIQPLRDRVAALMGCGVRAACMRFDTALAVLDAHAFVERILVAELGVRAVVIGDDFRFGHGRGGDAALLAALGAEHGFTVDATHTHADDGERISSTRVRALLGAGDLAGAEALLGRGYRVCGRVRRGDARGRRLGVPTANLVPGVRLALRAGVYAADVVRADGSRHAGAAHWGDRGRLEVHLLDFAGELYGELIAVELRRFLRDDERFDDDDALGERMRQDIDGIRNEG